ncbi:putative Calcium/calmodulin-dependent protein kinase [Desulfamplus magnetovallimortis]|uniref:Putative Calcium/calmodulin-dependent protein kinase n=1 Tax=Desulfamplus magnetovallimortis TaxID=1246637 RepID=A0A1W1HFI4_9BACT|nr:serine/threonine-protein kinase [Desulfamplus magnetovallimortis]SLM31230.1 putative Calcium/calmodulin-dependent protein kinase [Desulfamplus magnetovallimortis]
MVPETILMFGLTKSEELLTRRLTRSFEIRAEAVGKLPFKEYEQFFRQKKISLVIIHVDENRIRQVEKIRRIKKILDPPVPLLVLLPKELLSNINHYLKAGADDFIAMPIQEESFAIRFYVLLECGQAILQTSRASNHDGKKNTFLSEKNSTQKNSTLKEKSDAPPKNVLKEKSEHQTQNALKETNETEENQRIYTGSEKKGTPWNRIVGYLHEGLGFFTPKSQFARREKKPIFNKWQPVRKIATGGDGIIWLVKEIGREREAVAKIPHNSTMNISALRAAAVLKRLVYHPNVVHLIEIVKDNDKFILINEYVEGLTLPKRLETRMPPLEKEKIFLQLLSVTAHAHDHKIMHRDIKPENIMIRKDGILKLLDFGSAKEISWVDGNISPHGTLNFMPPEQIQGKTCLASDIWALGIILYIFSLNRLPFCNQDNSAYPMDIELNMCAVPPRKINPDISNALEEVIMTCLEEHFEKRYQNASVLQNDLLEKIPDFGNGTHIPA